MELYNNEVILSRDEQSALGVDEVTVAAHAIGDVWRQAVLRNTQAQETCISAEQPTPAVDNYTGVSYDPAYQMMKRLRRERKRLEQMGFTALRIEDETLPPPDVDQDL